MSRYLRQISSQFLMPYRRTIFIACGALVFTAAIMLSLGQGVRWLVDFGLQQKSLYHIQVSLLISIGLIVCLAGGTFTRFYFMSWIGERVIADVRLALFEKLLTLDVAYFEQNDSRTLQARITNDTTLLQSVVGSSLSIALRNSLLLLGGLIWLFITNLKLTSIVLGVIPIVIIPILYLGRRVRKLSAATQDRLSFVGGNIGEALQHIKTIKAFTYEQGQQRLFTDLVEHAFTVAKKRILQRSWLIALVITLVLTAIGFMCWIGSQDVLQGRMTPGELTAFIFYATIVAGSIGALSEVLTELQRALGALERIAELLALTPTLYSPHNGHQSPLHGDVSFTNITFSYPTRTAQPVLKNITFHIQAGQHIGIVGPSGAGKSTLLDLILRFYDVQTGCITLDGHAVSSYDLHHLRQQIGFVPQHILLTNGSIRDNICYGRAASDAAVQEAARMAHAAEFIDALPDGYETLIGENGQQLSGGQRQRLGIARALLHQPALLLFDEATNALDANSAAQIDAVLKARQIGHTVITVAHKIAGIQYADQILVLEQGQLVDLGTHVELLSRCPLYEKLARLQSLQE